jgi:hypothetical protein
MHYGDELFSSSKIMEYEISDKEYLVEIILSIILSDGHRKIIFGLWLKKRKNTL